MIGVDFCVTLAVSSKLIKHSQFELRSNAVAML